MSLDLDAIKARADAATKPPWIASDTDLAVATEDGRRLIPLAEVLLSDEDTRETHPQAAADAEFIAHARTDGPELVAEVETLRRLLAAMVDPGDILPDPCIPDVRGRGCHAHGFLDLKPGEQCPVGEARELLGGVA